MQTIKTAVVVVLLLGVCYGAYVALNAPEPTLPETLQDWNEDAMALQVENGAAVDIPQLSQTPAPDALDSLAPPAVTPPAPAGPTPPGLSLPNSALSLNSNPAKTPDIVGPPPPKPAGTDKKNGLGNDVPNLPELALPTAKEGDSVPLPDLPEPGASLPSFPSLAGAPGSAGSAAPPMPTLPGQNESLGTPSSTDNFPASPGLLTDAKPSSMSGTGVTKPENKSGSTAQPFATAREQALKLADEGKLREALAMMSPYFDHIELTHQEHLDLMDLLDALAGEVIYSRRHFLENKFIVSPVTRSRALRTSIASRLKCWPISIAWAIRKLFWLVRN